MTESGSSKGNRRMVRTLLAILLSLIGAALIAAIIVFIISPHDQVNIPLLAELPRTEITYNGFTLQMDGSAQERFYLKNGFADPSPTPEVEDHLTRDVLSNFQIQFTRWQLKDISIRFHLLPFQGTEKMSLLLNGKAAGSVYLASGYQDVVFTLPNDLLVSGDNLLEFNQEGGSNPGAALDYIRWEVGGDALSGELGVDRRSDGDRTVPVLGLAGSGEVNFYMNIPHGAKLALGLGHDHQDVSGGAGHLTIWGRSEQGAGRVIWEGDFPHNGIQHLDLDLGDLQGSISLLSFYIQQAANQQDWLYLAEPHLVVPKTNIPQLPASLTPPSISKKHPRTIVLICEDALRRDFLPIYGKDIVRTPNLDNIATNALIFDNAYSPSSWTKHVFASIFTAQPGARHGATKHEFVMRNDLPTLAEQLDKNHWRTAILTANPYTSEKFGLMRGFDDYFDLFLNADLTISSEDKVYAESFEPVLTQWLASLAPGEDAFVVIHMMDTHTPYTPPPAYKDLYKDNAEKLSGELHFVTSFAPDFLRKDIESQLLAYCASITYFDVQLPKILDAFKKAGRNENTTYIFFADHGEEFLDHGGVKHGFTLYQEMIHVPLMMWGEGIIPRRTTEIVNLEDLMPTLLNLVGAEVPPGLEGRSFIGLLGGQDAGWDRPQFAEAEQNPPNQISLILDGWKLINRANIFAPSDLDKSPLKRQLVLRGSAYELYDLQKDSLERNNLHEQNPIHSGFLKGMLVQWWNATHSTERGQIKTATLDARTMEILKGLGYVQ